MVRSLSGRLQGRPGPSEKKIWCERERALKHNQKVTIASLTSRQRLKRSERSPIRKNHEMTLGPPKSRKGKEKGDPPWGEQNKTSSSPLGGKLPFKKWALSGEQFPARPDKCLFLKHFPSYCRGMTATKKGTVLNKVVGKGVSKRLNGLVREKHVCMKEDYPKTEDEIQLQKFCLSSG